MSLPKLRYIAMSLPLAIVTGLAGVWIAQPSGMMSVTVPRGTLVWVRLNQPLGSKASNPGDPFEATLSEPVRIKGRLALPAGTGIKGKVVDACSAGSAGGTARLRLTLNSLELQGRVYELHTTDVAQYGSGYVPPDWRFIDGGARPRAPEGGAGLLTGARAGTGTVAGKKDVRLAAGIPLKFRLIEPLVLALKK